MWQVWLIISGLFLILEIATVGFLIFWFSIGAIIAMIVSMFTDNVIIQSSVFLISSTFLLLASKPLVEKYVKPKNIPTNSYSLLHKTGIVIKEIHSSNIGQVKVNNETWSAISENSITIEENSEIEVLSIEGVKLLVKPL